MPRRRQPTRHFEELQRQYLPIINTELRAGRSLPTKARLRDLGHSALVNEIEAHGGNRTALRRMGFWSNPQLALTPIRHLCQNGALPSRTTLERAGLKNILSLFFFHFGGVEEFAGRVGLRTAKAASQDTVEATTRRIEDAVWAATLRLQRIPAPCELPNTVRCTGRSRGGIQGILRTFLGTRCPEDQCAWLVGLLAEPVEPPPDRRKPPRYWQEDTIRRAWAPYARRLKSDRHVPITRMLVQEQRWDVLESIRGRGGYRALFRQWGIARPVPTTPLTPEERQALAELERYYPKLFRHRVFPAKRTLQRECDLLYRHIRLHCGGLRSLGERAGYWTHEEWRLRQAAFQRPGRIRRSLAARFPSFYVRGVLPSKPLLRTQDPELYRLICSFGTYERLARRLGCLTYRQHLLRERWRTILVAIGRRAIATGRFPTLDDLLCADRIIVRNAGGMKCFLATAARDAELRRELQRLIDGLGHEYRHDGADPHRHQSLLSAHNSLCLILNEVEGLV